MTRQAAFQTDVDVPVFVGLDPRGGFMSSLADHRACFHRGVHFIAGAIEEAGIDEHDAFFRSADAFFQVDGGATLFIHDADFQGVAWQAECVFDTAEQFVGERHFFRAVHFRFDDVNRARAGVGELRYCR